MSVMFASRSQQPVGAGYLLEFQAGRTLMEPGSTSEKRKAVAKPEPGLVYIKHSQDDQLLHFCWKNRQSNKDELDLIIFPGETEFLHMKECKDGRVYMLKFKNSQERHLFWMQDQDESKDEEIKKKMNDLLSNVPPTRTPTTAAARAQNNPLSGYAAIQNAIGGNLEDIGAIGNMDQNQLMRLFSLVNGGGNPADLLPQLGQIAAANTPVSASGPSSRRGTSQAQSGDSSKEKTPAPMGGVGQGISAKTLSQIINALPAVEQAKKRTVIDLSAILTRNNTKEVVAKYADQLTPHLPDQKPHQDAKAEMEQTVANPQFQQAAGFLGHALQTGQMGAALEQFQLNKSVVDAAKKGDLVEFAEKLTAQQLDKKIEEEADKEENVEAAQKKTTKKGEEEKKGSPDSSHGDDDHMELD